MNLNAKLYDYLENNSSPETELLIQIRRNTFLKTTHPHMISGHIQGRFLSLISKIINPKNILEIGTFTGYATLCLAEGLQKNGKIITLDNNIELKNLCLEAFLKSEFSNQIEFKIGDAKNIIPEFDIEFDLVFLDADKENYCLYLDLILPKLKSGGIILVDNVLWYEKVLEETSDKVTNLIQEFNKKVQNNPHLEVVIIPIRDGISLIRKK